MGQAGGPWVKQEVRGSGRGSMGQAGGTWVRLGRARVQTPGYIPKKPVGTHA